jgi:hypothetical protein
MSGAARPGMDGSKVAGPDVAQCGGVQAHCCAPNGGHARMYVHVPQPGPPGGWPRGLRCSWRSAPALLLALVLPLQLVFLHQWGVHRHGCGNSPHPGGPHQPAGAGAVGAALLGALPLLAGGAAAGVAMARGAACGGAAGAGAAAAPGAAGCEQLPGGPCAGLQPAAGIMTDVGAFARELGMQPNTSIVFGGWWGEND